MLEALFQHYSALLRYRALIAYLVSARQQGKVFRTLLGRGWHLIEPLAHMGVYYLLLVVVLQAGPRYGVNPFLFILLGLGHYLLIQRTVAYASGSILSQRNLMMQVAIEPLIFPAVAFQHAAYDFAAFFLLILLAYAALGPSPTWALLAYPLLLLVLACLAWALGIFVATASVFVRDTQRVANVTLRLLLYASPVIYAVDFVPASYRDAYLFNPIATLFGLFHWAFFDAAPPGIGHVLAMTASVMAMLLGAHLFYRWARVRFTKAF